MMPATAWPRNRPAVDDDPAGVLVARLDRASDVVERQAVAGRRRVGAPAAPEGDVRIGDRRFRGALEDRARAGDRLEAAEPAAAALGAVVLDDDMADLAGAESVAVEQLAAEDDAGADAEADLDRHQVRSTLAARTARWRGPPRGCRWRPRPGRRAGFARISPRGRFCQSRLTAQRIVPVAASTMPGVPTPMPRRVARVSRDSSSISSWTTSSHCSPSRPTTGRSIVRWTWPRRSSERGDEDVLAEVEADDVAGAVDELEQDRRLAAGRRPAPDLARQAVVHQVADHVTDRRSA